MASVLHPDPPSPAEVADHWRRLAEEWTQWWGRMGSGIPLPAVPDSAPTIAYPTTAGACAVDAAALAALNEKYRKRWEALWAAAAAAGAPRPGSPPAPLPEIAEPAVDDRRFAAREWIELPFFALMKQGYLLASEYLHELARLPELPLEQKERLAFFTKQLVDALAPSNFAATNPEVLKRALSTDGASLVRGYANLAADARKGRISMSDETAFEVGRNLAATPGSVVFRNDLIELIQYAPTTARVRRRPLVMVPPCINKYYVLDLRPENSFVRWAVGEGQTVFMISWRNIPPELGRLTWDDYIEDGVLAALDVAKDITGSKTLNTLGFCVGGTLLASALAVRAARGDRSAESVTLLTTMLDFADPGEIGVYVSRELLAARESALMAGQRIRGSELASAFASLRPNQLVWNYVINNYLKGETPPAFDLLYWNGDSANLPGPMYVYYLRNMYLDNALRDPGALTIAGESIDLGRVRSPVYVFASRDDHIVPWRSAYESTRLLGGDMTFVLGASGHIAGVVNPPSGHRRNYWTNGLLTDDADDWFDRTQTVAGSWWPHWGTWLAPHGGALRSAPRAEGNARHPALAPAPGQYVRDATT
jgi:polyhydroxyalkanoate synthase